MAVVDQELLGRKKIINQKITEMLKNVHDDFPEIQGLGALLGTATGGTISYALLYSLGTTGLSAVGITSGLAAAGLGAGMVAGVGALMLPVAILGVGAYALLGKIKKNSKIETVNNIYQKCLELQIEILPEKEKFEEEIKAIIILKNTLEVLKKELKA